MTTTGTVLRFFMKIPHGMWASRVREEAEANQMSMAAFVLAVFKLGYEVYRDDGLKGELKRGRAA